MDGQACWSGDFRAGVLDWGARLCQPGPGLPEIASVGVVLKQVSVLGEPRKIPMSSTFLNRWLPAGVCAWLLVAGCAPKIGDSCTNSNDCSASGDRLCDTTQLGGYCTIFNCDPTSCPSDESICVQFGSVLSTVGNCGDPQRPPPQSRTFCMAKCKNNGDCRGGYLCTDLALPNPWGASVVQSSPSTTKICIEPQQATPISEADPDRSDAVCGGVDQSAGGAGAIPEANGGGAGQSGTGVGP